MKDDENPYFKIQAINYPITANGINYQESFFEEFISKLKNHPIPGDKFGHEMQWGKRPTTDFILIGARIDKKNNGKGTVYLKNYIPPVGESGDNAIFIRENKSNMIHYSLVSYTKDEILNDKNGKTIINVVGSVKGERNDAVEIGLGAMDQKTNDEKKYNPYPNEHSARIRDPGDFQKGSFRRKTIKKGISIIIGRLKGETTTTTQAYRFDAKVFTATQAKAWLKKNKIKYISFEKATGKGNIINDDIDYYDYKEGNYMNKEELLEVITTMKTNAEITLVEIAEAMGLSDQVVSEKHKNAIAISEEFVKLNIENPVEVFQIMQKQIKENEKAIFNAQMTEEFGTDKLQNGSENLLKIYAIDKLKNIESDKLDEAIKNLKENDPIAKKLSADIADFSSDINTIAVVEQKEKNPAKSNRRKVDKV